MQRWKYFLTADRAEDLSRADFFVEWAKHYVDRFLSLNRESQAREMKLVPIGALQNLTICKPTPEDTVSWERRVKALRSVAARLGEFRGRAAGIAAQEADQIMAEHVSRLIPILQLDRKPIRTASLRFVPPAIEDIDSMKKSEQFEALASMFFQSLFAGFLQSDPVCSDCGESLPPTPKGRPRRASRCRRCARKQWWNSLPLEERRKREREKKAQQRKGTP